MDSLDYYNQNYMEYFESTIDLDLSSSYIRFLKYIPSGGHILDAGCGSGRDSLYFINKGYEVTAFDASESLVKLSSSLIKKNVLNMRFQSVNFNSDFNGIWACASLLHVNRLEIDAVLQKLVKSLKSKGVIYASFKYGREEMVKESRYFNCYDEASIDELLSKFSEIELVDRWVNNDLRSGKTDERWLNIVIRKSVL